MDSSRGRPAAALAVFADRGSPGTPLTTGEVADALECSPSAAVDALETLVEGGRLAVRDVGAPDRIWWRPAGTAAAPTDDAVAADVPAAEPASADGPESSAETPPADEHDAGEQPVAASEQTAPESESTAAVEGGSDGDASDPTVVGRARELVRSETLLTESRDVTVVMDPDGTFRYVSPSASHVYGYEPETLIGENAFDYVHPEDRAWPREEYERLAADPDYEPKVEFRWRRGDGSWIVLEARGRNLLDDPIIGGIVVYTRDVTERRERETFLRGLYETTASADLDLDAKIERLLELGRDRFGTDFGLLSRIEGDRFEVVHSVDAPDSLATGRTVPLSETCCRKLLDVDGPVAVEGVPEDGWPDVAARECHGLECFLGTTVEVNGTPVGTLCFGSESPACEFDETDETLLDLTSEWISRQLHARRTRDRLAALHEYTRELFGAETTAAVSETVVEAATDVIDLPGVLAYTYDEDAGALTLDAACDGTTDLAPVFETVAPDDSSLLGHAYAAGESCYYPDVRDSPHLRSPAGEIDLRSALIVPTGEHGVLAVGSSDVDCFGEGQRHLVEILAANATAAYDGVARGHELDRYRRIVENVPVGVYRNTPGPDGEFVEMDETLAGIFDADSAEELMDCSVSDLYTDPRERAAFSRRLDETGIVRDVELEQETLDGRRIWISVTAIRTVEDGDVYFDGVVQDVTERVEREAEIERQREQLAALDDLNRVVRDVNEAIVERSTREEIERAVCERLAASDAYTSAWTCELDPKTRSIVPRVGAGVEEPVDAADRSTADGEAPSGPIARAVRTQEMQASNEVAAAHADRWCASATDREVRSAAAVPVVHEDTVYGVVTLRTDREDAFTDEERQVVAHLGEVIGHAIAATDRKRALMSDDVVEVEFRVPAVLDDPACEASTTGEVAVEDTVAVGDDEFLQYGTVSGDGFAVLRAATASFDHWEAATLLDADVRVDGEGADRSVDGEGADRSVDGREPAASREGDDPPEGRFELRLSEPPVVSAVAAHGGSVEAATIEAGDFHVVVHLPPSVDVRRIVSRVQDAYPRAEMVTRRQVTRRETGAEVRETLIEGLTDRQRAALEASYHAGFFDWPRESSGEEVAESLDVSAPTFHQHLRKAERKLLSSVLD